jgi:hypothetical protein
MKKTLLLSALSVIFFQISCKKDNNSTGQNNSLPKTYTEDIRSSVIGNSVTTYNLVYDANNRQISMTSTPAPPVLKFVYAYVTDKTFTLDMYTYGTLSIHENFWINTASLIDSTFQYNDTQDTSTEKYIYDTNKQLIQKKEYDYSSSVSSLYNTTSYTYDNLGNPITETDDQGKSITNDYYTDLPNTLTMGMLYTPQSKNLVKTSTLNSGGSTETATHFYTFDSSKRLIKDSVATTGSDLIAIKSYTY